MPLDLDSVLEPDPIEWKCIICHQPLTVKWHWMPYLNHWMHASVHNACAAEWMRQQQLEQTPSFAQEMPARFQNFVSDWFKDKVALNAAAGFDTSAQYKTLALIGEPGRGKSRLAWNVIKGWFNELEAETGRRAWVESWSFNDLMTSYDRHEITKIKQTRYVFIDDIGSTQSYGQQRAQLQDVIRFRVQQQLWTWLTIDDASFDPGFEALFQERAVTIHVSL